MCVNSEGSGGCAGSPEPSPVAYELIHELAHLDKKATDQPGRPPNLIRVFLCAQWVAQDPSSGLGGCPG